MTKPPPGGDRRAGVLHDNGDAVTPLSTIASRIPSNVARLDDLTRAELRALWWRQIRLGNRLPAEPGVIILSGGADPDWPRPQTETPQPESRRGGRR